MISNGVLHHTGDCRVAFNRIGRLVRPGGHLVVGLYNRYSRSLHYARRALFRLTGLTSHMPNETSHTLDETLAWMTADGFDFMNSVPKPAIGPLLTERERLFEPRPPGTPFGRLASQLAAMSSGYHEDGFFVVFGRKR